jgi:hypothetical protein
MGRAIGPSHRARDHSQNWLNLSQYRPKPHSVSSALPIIDRFFDELSSFSRNDLKVELHQIKTERERDRLRDGKTEFRIAALRAMVANMDDPES